MNYIIKSRDELLDYNKSKSITMLVHNFDLRTLESINEEDKDTGDYFKWGGKNTKFPHILVDTTNYEKEYNENILRVYITNLFNNIVIDSIKNYIILNRIYRFKVENRTFIIQILFKKIGTNLRTRTRKFFIFIFECFENIDTYLQTIDPKYHLKDTESINFLRSLNNEIYTLVCYRDILSTFDEYSQLFFNETGLYNKVLTYYGAYLMTADAYRRHNFLSVLFYIYGIILKESERIYLINSYGYSYSDFIILQLTDATSLKHTDCPYCKLGFRYAKKGLNDSNNELISNYNQETKTKIIQNKDIYRLTNKYYCKILTQNNISQLHCSIDHFMNPSTTHLDVYVLDKIKESYKLDHSRLGNKLVMECDLLEKISYDLRELHTKRLLIFDYIDFIEDCDRKNRISKRIYEYNN